MARLVITVISFCLIALTTTVGLPDRIKVAQSDEIAIPFMFENQNASSLEIKFDTKTLASVIYLKKTRLALPSRHLAIKAIPIGENKVFILARTIFAGNVRAFLLDKQQLTISNIELPVSLQNRLPIYVTRFGSRIAMVLYDRKKRSSLLYVWRLEGQRLIAEDIAGLPITFGGLYEINIPIYSVKDESGLLLCGGQSCYNYISATGGKVATLIKTKIADNVQLIEFAYSELDGVHGLFIKMADDRINPLPLPNEAVYFVAQLPEGKLIPLDPGKIPANILVDENGLQIKYAESLQDFAEMFASDLISLPLSGAMILGIDNIEGRVSWVQHYYLNGLIDVVASEIDGSAPRFEFANPIKKQLKQRLKLEIRLLDQLLSEEPQWLLTRRYSLNRQPLLSAIHVGRAIKTLLRYQTLVEPDFKLASLARLKNSLFDSSDRMDQLILATEDNNAYIRIKKGVPFLHDGLNAPYNVQNGWAEGVALAYSGKKELKIAASVIKLFLENERIQSSPDSSNKWSYWWGDGFEGYNESDNLSVNSPNYAGYKEPAHVSYRSMDAIASLRVNYEHPNLLREKDRQYLCRGVESGGLYPFVSRELELHGLKPDIPFHIARLYARIASPWEIENSVWALEALTNRTRAGCKPE